MVELEASCGHLALVSISSDQLAFRLLSVTEQAGGRTFCVRVMGAAQVPAGVWVDPTRNASKHFSHPLDPRRLAGERAALPTLSLLASRHTAFIIFICRLRLLLAHLVLCRLHSIS